MKERCKKEAVIFQVCLCSTVEIVENQILVGRLIDLNDGCPIWQYVTDNRQREYVLTYQRGDGKKGIKTNKIEFTENAKKSLCGSGHWGKVHYSRWKLDKQLAMTCNQRLIQAARLVVRDSHADNTLRYS